MSKATHYATRVETDIDRRNTQQPLSPSAEKILLELVGSTDPTALPSVEVSPVVDGQRTVNIQLTLPEQANYSAETLGLLGPAMLHVIEQHRQQAFRGRLNQLLSAVEVPDDLADAYLKLHQREQVARERFLKSVSTLTAVEVGNAAGHRNKNEHSTAHRWKKAGKIFGIPVGKEERYPAFQFDINGQPLPAVAQVLIELVPHRKPWSIAFWFVSANGYLGGETPVSYLEKDPSRVVAAAHQDVAKRGD